MVYNFCYFLLKYDNAEQMTRRHFDADSRLLLTTLDQAVLPLSNLRGDTNIGTYFQFIDYLNDYKSKSRLCADTLGPEAVFTTVYCIWARLCRPLVPSENVTILALIFK